MLIHGVICAAEAFLGAEIGLKQNLLILVSMRAVVLKWLVPEMDETEPVGPDVGAAWAAETVSSVSFCVSSELWSLARVSWSAVKSEAIMRVRSPDPRVYWNAFGSEVITQVQSHSPRIYWSAVGSEAVYASLESQS